ncbi:unnamed protein product (macronuclear) [Paramecium tetraurelia]|uniref:Cystatin domain-containing protein n=1 Tax=Paramecium tetraurelia TaxID=5888 RepID=A0BJN1_PARTE|nr:uncharacterized protein GSPATT00029376001 [Paramecium tetraurelia]CAK58748.1 unnamed protein product [Paramecium tetraurelia]|eukprot:XP_001426146.1 hypothetical protein (macronuclear) [Paramecium tetraurelia strain d4-2]
MKLLILLILLSSVLCREYRPMAGGRFKPDQNDEGLGQAITYAKQHFETSCDGTSGYEWDTTTDVEQQIVNGSNYYISAQLRNGDKIKKVQIVVYMPASPPDIRITSCSVL